MDKQALSLDQIKAQPLLFSALPAAGLGLGAYHLAKKQKEKGKKSLNPWLAAGLAGAAIPAIQGLQGYGIIPALQRFGAKGLLSSKAEQLGRSDMPSRAGYLANWYSNASRTDGSANKFLKELQEQYPDSWRYELWRSKLPLLSQRETIPNTIEEQQGRLPIAIDRFKEEFAPFRDTPDMIHFNEQLRPDPKKRYFSYDNNSTLKASAINFNMPVSTTKREVLADPALTFYEKNDISRILDNAGAGKRGIIDTTDISRGVIGAGLGYAGAGLFGRVFGSVFGGLSPKSQKILQNTGAVAGLLRNTGIWQN